MDAFDLADTRPTKPPSSISALVFNTLTLLILVGVVCVALASVHIYFNPQSSINPFPPPTQPTPLQFPTATPTPPNVLPPTWTPAPTLEPSLTFTPRLSATDTPASTPDDSLPEEAPTPGGMSFVPANGTPLAISSLTFYPDSCNWMGVGGQVFDMSSAPLSNIELRLGGTLNGEHISEFDFLSSLSGTQPVYGPSGYEFKLADIPQRSISTLWLQLVDQAGLPLSDKVYFDTYEECEKNLILINFQQVN